MLADIEGLTYRMFDYWCRTGIIRLRHDADGSGSRRLVMPDEEAAIRELVQFNENIIEQRDRMSRGEVFQELLAKHRSAA